MIRNKSVKVVAPTPRKRELSSLSKHYGLNVRKINAMDAVCKKNGTSIKKIPAWLLRKDVKRLEYWFKEGK